MTQFEKMKKVVKLNIALLVGGGFITPAQCADACQEVDHLNAAEVTTNYSIAKGSVPRWAATVDEVLEWYEQEVQKWDAIRNLAFS